MRAMWRMALHHPQTPSSEEEGAYQPSLPLLFRGGGWGVVRSLTLTLLLLPTPALAQSAPGQTAIPGALDRAFSQIAGAQSQGSLSLSLQLLLIMGLLTILPSLILMMTSFTRILVVLSILRTALGLQQSPPNQILIGLSLFLSLFVMAPTLDKVNANAIQPYSTVQINASRRSARRAWNSTPSWCGKRVSVTC